MPIGYLDGRRFREAVVAGAGWVRHRREHINRINVFPVADGDTGTNMALSLAATASALRASRERGIGSAARVAAEASILGAKGNSGVILAHWFLGVSRTLGSLPRADAPALADALASAADHVYAGLDEPVEGTILSVMRAVGEQAGTAASTGADLGAFIRNLVDAGEAALARTPSQLAVLRESGVVDAGAQGFVDFLEGVARLTRGEAPGELHALDAGIEEVHAAGATGELTERYCTEVVLRGAGIDDLRLRRALRGHGGSLLVVAVGGVAKVHIHTDHPDEILRIAARFGEISERKVDDMQRQRLERSGGSVRPLVPLPEQPARAAVICDSTCDLPLDVRVRHGIEIAPLQVLFGDEVYRDQVDLEAAGFYRRLAAGGPHPTTSQPPPRAFVEALDRIRGDREVVVLTLSGALSGTYDSARSGAALAPHPRVEVFDTRSTSLGLGLIVLNAARLAALGASVDTILEWAARWRDDSGLVFGLATLEYLRRGGRIGAAQSLVGNLLGLRPILGLDDGSVAPIARARGAAASFARVDEAVAARLPAGTRVRLGLVDIDAAEQIERIEARLRDRYEVVEVVRSTPTGVIGAHAGPGAWGVFYQRVRTEDPVAARAG